VASSKNSAASKIQWPTFSADIDEFPLDDVCPIQVKKSYNRDIEPQILYPEDNKNITIEIKELERLEIYFSEGTGGLAPMSDVPLSNNKDSSINVLRGFQVIGNRMTTLPIGSTLDVKSSVFAWEPGVGFLGTHRLVFLLRDAFGHLYRKIIDVKIVPAGEQEIEENQ
jgi:hypothetical protein